MLNLENIPHKLRGYKNWVVYGLKKEDYAGNQISPKVAFNVNPNSEEFGSLARSNDPSTWCTWENAVSILKHGYGDGIGFVFTPEVGVKVVDCDCHTEGKPPGQAKQIQQWYESFETCFSKYPTYVERSLSGKGLHMLVDCKLLPDRGKGTALNGVPLELYESKMVRLTGDLISEVSEISDSEAMQNIVWGIQTRFFPKTNEQQYQKNGEIIPWKEKPVMSDDLVLSLAMRQPKFSAIYNNRWEKFYSSGTYATMGFAKMLSFWTANCPSQMQRLLLQSPFGKNRLKEDPVNHPKEIQRDIIKAVQTCTAVYSKNINRKGEN